ncbi:MAG: hypothetical protein ACXABY_04590 [Candidatus Thorarchaeota archaeon]|jgi:hypothetical protein
MGKRRGKKGRMAVKSCLGKTRYPKREDAQDTVDYLEEEFEAYLKVYFCPLCSGYHLASAENE